MRRVAELKIMSEVQVDSNTSIQEDNGALQDHYSDFPSQTVNVDILAQFEANLDQLELMQSKLNYMLSEVSGLITKK